MRQHPHHFPWHRSNQFLRPGFILGGARPASPRSGVFDGNLIPRPPNKNCVGRAPPPAILMLDLNRPPLDQNRKRVSTDLHCLNQNPPPIQATLPPLIFFLKFEAIGSAAEADVIAHDLSQPLVESNLFPD